MARKKKNKAPPKQDAATPPAGQPPLPPQLPPYVPPVFLFRKKLDQRDVGTVGVQGQVVIEECCEEMKTVLANLEEEESYFCLRIIAEDILGNVYELRFANFTGGNYAVFHQWGDVVTFNHLRERDTVECWGNFVGEDEIHATLLIHRAIPAMVNQPPENPEEKEQESPEKPDQETAAVNQENEVRLKSLQLIDLLDIEVNPTANKETPVEGETPEVVTKTDRQPEGSVEDLPHDDVLKGSEKYLEEGVPHIVEEVIIPTGNKEAPVEGQIPVENRGPESEPGDGEKQTEEPAPEEPEFLFEKKLDYADVNPGLDRLVFTRCSEKLKTALEVTPSIRVSTVDANNNVEHTSMLFKRYVVDDKYTLCREWQHFVARNALKVGDSVIGLGNDVGRGEFRVQLYILRDGPDVKTEEERKEDARRLTLLLLGKDPATVLGRVVINSTSKEVAEVVVARKRKFEENEEDDEGGQFARFSAVGANGVKYEWSEEVDEDGLNKSVNGYVVGDGEVQMWIDVYKGRRH